MSDDLCDDERLYYLNDANMNVTALVQGLLGDEDLGKVVERYMYDPYGKVTALHGDPTADADGDEVTEWNEDSNPDWDNCILYCGYYRDAETGLYHVRNRMYHIYLAWLQREPPGYEYVDGMSLYEYVASNPVGSIDPSGRVLVVMSAAHRPRSDMDRLKNLTRDAILIEVKAYDCAGSPIMFVQRAWYGPLEGFYERVLRSAYRDFKNRKANNRFSLEQFVAIGHSSGASAIYNEIKRGTFNQADPRLVPAYLGMIDRVLPLMEKHELTGSLSGLNGTLIDDFYGRLRRDPLPGASLSFDVSKGGEIEDPYADPKTGKKGKARYHAMPKIGHVEMTGASWEDIVGYHPVLDQIPFRAREVYLKRVREEQQVLGDPPSWDTSKPENGW